MSVVLPLPTWDLAAWDADVEPRDWPVELVRGVLSVSPGESLSNRRTCDRLVAALNTALPSDWVAVSGLAVTVAGGPAPTVRRPDVMVLPDGARDLTRYDAADVALLAEVVSPTSAERDWVTKLGEYALAQIPAYLVVDPAAGVLALFTEPVPGAGYTRRSDDGRLAVWSGAAGTVRIALDDLLT